MEEGEAFLITSLLAAETESNGSVALGAFFAFLPFPGHPVWAFRMSYAGELGWELHHPMEMQAHLLEVQLGLVGVLPVGFHVVEAALEVDHRLALVADHARAHPPQAIPVQVAGERPLLEFVGHAATLRKAYPWIKRIAAMRPVPSTAWAASGGATASTPCPATSARRSR